MKRHITELEKSLIEKGWCLDRKHYFGKGSNKVKSYVYTTWIFYYELKAELELNKTRTEIIDIRVANDLPPMVNNSTLATLEKVLINIKNSVMPNYKVNDEDEEIVEILENENNVDSE